VIVEYENEDEDEIEMEMGRWIGVVMSMNG